MLSERLYKRQCGGFVPEMGVIFMQTSLEMAAQAEPAVRQERRACAGGNFRLCVLISAGRLCANFRRWLC